MTRRGALVAARPPRPEEVTPEGFVICAARHDPEPPPARALRLRTHCQYGHAFTAANTLVTETGRRCRACLAIRGHLPPPAQFQEVPA
jgi:hypothetical protein